jgi:hypothetical protein
MGRIVTYERLCTIAGHSSSNAREKHILHQHLLWIKSMLKRQKLPCVLAVARDVGYALCLIPPARLVG